jgi:hypothetical protein
MLTDFTSPDTIRALLGVHELEIEDAELLQPMHAFTITEGLLDIGAAVPTQYAAIAATPAATRTATETRYYETVRFYSAALVAQAVLPALPMFAPQSLEDEKDKMKRFDGALDALKESLSATLTNLKAKIVALIAILVPGTFTAASITRSFVSATGIAADPVTGS